MRPVQHLQRSVEQLNLRRVGRALTYSVLIGLVAGAGAIAFQYLTDLRVRDVMGGGAPVTIAESAPLGEILRTFAARRDGRLQPAAARADAGRGGGAPRPVSGARRQRPAGGMWKMR